MGGAYSQLKVGILSAPAVGIAGLIWCWNSRMCSAILAHSKIVRDCMWELGACSTGTTGS